MAIPGIARQSDISFVKLHDWLSVRLRQPQSRGSKTSHSSQLKDAAEGPQAEGMSARQEGDQIDTPRCYPTAKSFDILDHRAVRMRPREQGGASTERRTGADPEKSNPPTPPGEWLQEVVNNGDFAKEISKL
ncbi:hypothetical protein T4E_11405 [Trichinella pseudospiralis]|uniref:Uncharacterized protein n=1 Tax=Trichinella pseudospiralis TaxID=6337 RepID=A0A0V0Y806_TRIPS|nr:hypothetical protein T4E_11405 [Trichinella pseudospiralis]